MSYWLTEEHETFWVIGGAFSSLNFHSIDPETTILVGPFKDRITAELNWKELSEEHRHKANYRFIITKES